MLEVRGLSKAFHTLTVAYQVSFSIPRGRRHAVIGPNGAGKTTLFNLIAGAVTSDAGEIIVDGVDVTGMVPDARVRAGLARSFQHNNLFSDMTVRENLAAACAVHQGAAPVFWRSFEGFGEILSTAEDLARTGSAHWVWGSVNKNGHAARDLWFIGSIASRIGIIYVSEDLKS